MKTHLAESLVPLTEGQTVWTLCKKQIPNTIWMFRWLPGEIDLESQNTLLMCKHCTDALVNGQCLGDHSYMYGVQNREEMKDSVIRKLGVLEESA